MLEGINDGLVEQCGMFPHDSTAVCSHETLRSLYSRRNLIKRFKGVFAKFSKADCSLQAFSSCHVSKRRNTTHF